VRAPEDRRGGRVDARGPQELELLRLALHGLST
jgi:hypothetical protein